MSELACYSMDLYCDCGNDCERSKNDSPLQLQSETRAGCVRHARNLGWTFHRDGTHSCPECKSPSYLKS